jgi:hypothetical protein
MALPGSNPRLKMVTLTEGTTSIATAPLAPPDPVFALIETHKRDWASFLAVLATEADTGEFCVPANDAFEALIEAKPTTPAGVAALILHLKDFSDTEAWIFDEGVALPLSLRWRAHYAGSVDPNNLEDQ